MITDKGSSSSSNPLEQFVLLSKSAKGAAAVELIKQVLEAPGVYMFRELLEMPSIKELENSPQSNYYHLLNLFSNGTYQDYLQKKGQLNLPELSILQKKKLQNLTIVTLSLENKCIPYKRLLEELDISNVRDLEDLIIEAIYSDIIHGKLDQRNSCLELDFAIGRDIVQDDMSSMIQDFQLWSDTCENVLKTIETQISNANNEKSQHLIHLNNIDTQISTIKKTLKNQSNTDAGNSEVLVNDPNDKNKKLYKLKFARGSSSSSSSTRFWQK